MFNSKKEFAIAMLEGRSFIDGDTIYYFEDGPDLDSPFRAKTGSDTYYYTVSMITEWERYNSPQLKEILDKNANP